MANASEYDILIGAALRSERKRLKLNQTQVGDAIGVTFQQIQKYENGKNRIAASTMLLLEDRLGFRLLSIYFDIRKIGGKIG